MRSIEGFASAASAKLILNLKVDSSVQEEFFRWISICMSA
jgi:hypothetical protein